MNLAGAAQSYMASIQRNLQLMKPKLKKEKNLITYLSLHNQSDS